jgi:hypothetical protein
MDWVRWAPLGAASLHIVEEFALPGGFAAWDRRYRPGIRDSITPRLHIIVNALLLIVCYDAGAWSGTRAGAALWLTVAALLFSNALWHLRGAIRMRCYSPGMVTGLLLYVPLTIYGYIHFLRTGQASIGTAAIAFAIGASYHLWAGLLHRRRAKARG